VLLLLPLLLLLLLLLRRRCRRVFLSRARAPQQCDSCVVPTFGALRPRRGSGHATARSDISIVVRAAREAVRTRRSSSDSQSCRVRLAVLRR